MGVNQPKRLIKMNTMELTSTGYWEIFRFELDSVDPGQSSGVIELMLNAIKGCLTEVKFQSESENADIALLVHPTAEVESIDCLYSKKGIDKWSSEVGMQALWARFGHNDVSTDNTSRTCQPTLYFKFDNKGIKPSGLTVIEIVYQIHSN